MRKRILTEDDLKRKLSEFTEDSSHRTVTDAEKTKWNDISIDLMIRVKQLESGLYEDIKGNPFFVNFKDLNGVKLTNGVYNEKQARLEC